MVNVTKKQVFMVLVGIAFLLFIAWLIKNQVSDWPKVIDAKETKPEESIL
jgi:hypothetical protein